MRTTFFGPQVSSSHTNLINSFAAAAFVSSPLSNTQKPLTRYSSAGTPSSEGNGRESVVIAFSSSVAWFTSCVEVPQQSVKEVLPVLNSSISLPPL